MAVVMRVFQWIIAGLGIAILGLSVIIGWSTDKGDIWVLCSSQSGVCEGRMSGMEGAFNSVFGGMVGLALILIAVLIAANTPHPVFGRRGPVAQGGVAGPGDPGQQWGGQYPPFPQQNAPQPPFGS
ncbi:hypothetical protein Val02_43840 [Virgisporangium aliadipatigenens]|uniref:Uncharacterized protein n=1 Tax=Virgisporangium aliadipatigenens TaxID=741659 RepID=A0A8J3YPM4_9ACTN|nr:hypothetical protein [Virgisporangium aliadipatigenens]GIJ47498.1 hypothetical protein Val02_43840 [Virgisporangium aliadipatigenens]